MVWSLFEWDADWGLCCHHDKVLWVDQRNQGTCPAGLKGSFDPTGHLTSALWPVTCQVSLTWLLCFLLEQILGAVVGISLVCIG